MPRLLLVVAALMLSLVLPASGQQAAPAPPAAAETVQKDTPRATPAGTTFTVPAGWAMTTTGAMVLLNPPEPDSHVAIVDLKSEKDAAAAVTAAWAAYKPGFNRPLKIVLPQSARNGWDEQKVFQYETSPNERAVVTALARRAAESSHSEGTGTSGRAGGPGGRREACPKLRERGTGRASNLEGREIHPL